MEIERSRHRSKANKDGEKHKQKEISRKTRQTERTKKTKTKINRYIKQRERKSQVDKRRSRKTEFQAIQHEHKYANQRL